MLRGPATEFTHSTRSEPMRNSRSCVIATSLFSRAPGRIALQMS